MNLNCDSMHEFSLAIEVIELVRREAEKHNAHLIREITIEVGDLSGVEADSFETAMDLLVKDTFPEEVRIHIIRIPGTGRCNSCDLEFEMNHRLDTCPKCRSFPSGITGGEEFRVQSLLVD
jgi:hydrogenase nickel incorporation protein HypA/HybF